MAKLAPDIPPLPSSLADQLLLAELLLIIRKGQKGGYGFCFPVQIEKKEENAQLLQPLKDSGVIEIRNSFKGGYAVVVVNRYVFERYIWKVYEATGYDKLARYADHITPDVAVYSVKSGVGFINGNLINFRRKQNKANKRLFDALYTAAPGSVDRKKLLKIIKQDDIRTRDTAYALSEAFTNLRKILLVNSKTIELRDSGKLNALTFEPDINLIKRLIRK